MSWLKNRSIGAKLGILSGIPIMILIFITMFYYYSSSETTDAFRAAYYDYTKPTLSIAIARIHLEGTQKDVLKTLVTNDPAEAKEATDDLARRRAQNQQIYEELGKMQPDDPKLVELFNKVKSIASQMRGLQDECVALGVQGKNQEAYTIFFNELEPSAEEYSDLINQLSNSLIEATDMVQKGSAEEARRSAITGSAATLVVTVIMILLSIVISRAITVPINAMKAKIALFASGDLTLDFKDKGRDVISQMSNELELMSESLKEVVESILAGSGRVSDSSMDFSGMAEETNATVEELRANVDEMSVNLSSLASSSEEINASVEEVAAGAQTTAEKGTDIARKVDDAMSAGENGVASVRSVVDGISRVAESSSAATSAVMELGNRARQIQNFVSQIGSIADQTNLLALNAAIEAARAGDAGRGFAVVAEEVRKLAEESNVAAKNIADLASAITSELDLIVKYSQENADDSSKAKLLSSDTENAIANMLAYLKEIASATQDLAAVAEEQAASSEEIAEAVQGMSGKINDTANAGVNIRTSVAEVAAASEKMAEGSENLSSLSGELQERLSFFRLDESSRGGNTAQAKNKSQLKALPGAR
ncbi:MAG: methyl-accepting chemotaxis protein [Synergistaceae bacterium]|nr:methyl-accepting chemotaxis protein [Synergistaceae bacterium]